MNRLIIIGNGFDIAHSLKTKYGDFILNYWKKITYTNYKDSFFEFKIPNYDISHCRSLKEVKTYLNSRDILTDKKNTNPHFHSKDGICIEVHNEFFCRINERFDSANWVDIEMEYFNCLKRILDRAKGAFSEDRFQEESLKQITRLNKEISEIAQEFDNYLEQEIMPEINKCYNANIKNILSENELYEIEIDRFLEEFPKREANNLKLDYSKKQTSEKTNVKFEGTYVLNFNYTNTISQYLKNNISNTILNIHGEVKNPLNPINLGFGDERNKFYSEIEDHNENEYLRFMKSFYYTNNSNYKKLFDFLEDSIFQIQIMGHSCGLSDRTLLNAIFEHRNCKSIKVYYHNYTKATPDGEKDNYTQIVRNISRHFNQKTMMREKIVNKDLCEELPQFKKLKNF